MLNKIRNDVAHNKVVRTLLIVIVLAFVFWGMGLQSLSFSKNYAIKVGAAEISPSEYFRAYQQAKQQLQAQFKGQEIPAELMKLFGIERQVTENLTSQALFENYAIEEDIFIDNQVIFDLLKKEKAFHKDGKFDKETYVAVLRQAQITPVEFEKTIIKQVQANLIANMFNQAVNVSDAELDMQVKYNQERRDIDILTLNAKDITTLPEATDEELTEIYESQKDSFKIAEKRDFNVLTISKEALAKEQTVTAEEIKEYFEANKDDFFTKPEFKVQQILVKDQAKADEVLAIADLKENFNKYVKQYSQDKFSKDKDGDMGWLTGDIFGAEFENMVHSTAKGEVATTAVKTPFGYHIFKLVDTKESVLKSFDSVKEKIKADLTNLKADDLLNEKIDAALDMSSAGESLTNIAKQLGFTLQNFTNVTAEGPQSYVATVFETNEGEISQPIELEFDATAFVEVTKITEESVKPLAEVKDQLVATFKQEKTAELLQEKADLVLTNIKDNGISFKQAVREHKLVSPIKSVVSLARTGNEKKQIANEIATEVFNAPANTLIEETLNSGNDIIIVKVQDVYQEKISNEARENVRKSLEMQKVTDLYLSFLQNLKATYKAKVNQRVIDQIIKQN